jgi:hypothetical protein
MLAVVCGQGSPPRPRPVRLDVGLDKVNINMMGWNICFGPVGKSRRRGRDWRRHIHWGTTQEDPNYRSMVYASDVSDRRVPWCSCAATHPAMAASVFQWWQS